MSPSYDHPNRKSHNWLVYYRHDQSLARHADRLRGRVVDLGAGSCSYRRWCLECADNYVAVDWQESAHRGQKDLIADLNDALPIESRYADSVISFSVIEHLHNPQSMICEAYRVLKPGGWLLLQVPWQWWIHEEPHDYFRFTPFCLTKMLNEAGFNSQIVEPQGGFFTMLALKINYFFLRCVKGPIFTRQIMRAVLWPFWQASQLTALALDRLDLHWDLETPAYFVAAQRPTEPPDEVDGLSAAIIERNWN